MNFMRKTVKNVLIIGMLLPGSALAASTTFYVLNSGDSVVNPINITSATLSYAVADGNPMCTGEVQLSEVVQTTKVLTGNPLPVVFTPPFLDNSCYYSTDPTDHGPEQFTLQIRTVDNKGIGNDCKVSGPFLYSPDDEVLAGNAIKITEAPNRFFCEYPIAMSNKK